MATWLKQSTAVNIALGPFLDDGDGKTAETALTISQADVRLKKNDGNWGQKSDSSSATHEENGWYEVALNSTDTNTLGILIVSVSESGALPVWREFMVVPANVYDSHIAGSVTQNVQVTGMNANVVTASALASDAVTEIQSGLATSSALATVDGIVDQILADTGTDIPNTLSTVSSQVTTVDNVVDAIKLKTDLIPGDMDGYSLEELIILMAAALLGKASGLDSTTAKFRNLTDSKDRIIATVDANGNRTAVTLDPS
jgi:hypothetical protein